MSKDSIICVVGPTAVGKSDVAIEVCRRIHGEVISADSMQVYQGMDIGTAKLTAAERNTVPHHLLDVIPPDRNCTVAMWKDWADDAIADILARDRIPVVCGGTGLYVRALVDNLDFAKQPKQPDARQKWEMYVDTYGPENLHRELERVDPQAAMRIHTNDVKRTIRALEVAQSRQDESVNYDWNRRDERHRTLQIGLWMERSVLYRRVEARVDQMIASGLVEEVSRLMEQGISPSGTALQAIGYKEMVEYMRKSITLEQATELIKRNTRRYVKRQLSWFRRDERIHWFERAADGRFEQNERDRLWSLITDFLEGNLCPAHE